MNDFRNRLYRFMSGRYGFDQLGSFLFAAGFALWLIGAVIRFIPGLRRLYMLFYILNNVMYIYAVFRIFSRNTYKRTLENERYIQIRNRVVPFLDKKTKNIRDRDYIYKNCPKCGARLRLRRIRGKHITKCPRCGTKFNVRVFIEYKKHYETGGFNN